MKKIAVLMFISVCATVFGQERYSINAFGFSVMPPEGWFVTDGLGKAKENLDRFNLNDKQRAEILKDYTTLSSFGAFYKYDPAVSSGIIPTINIVVKPVNVNSYQSFKKLLDSADEQYSKFLENYKTVSIDSITISDNRAWQMQSTYDFKNPAGQKVSLKSMATFFYCGSYYINLNYIEEVGKEDNTDVYNAMLKSVLLTLNTAKK